ncbi:hypothetical protein [Xanthomonas sacchari]|uniref:hypothetical protein n=1 Tax=Xanthomonas sacchari TaxID=56458 RepID=UPI003B216145
MILDDQGLPALDQFSADGFVDCIFKVDEFKKDADFYYFNLLASHNSVRVGFAVKIIRSIGPGFDRDMNLIKDHIYGQGVCFRSLGKISDDLLSALAALYGLDVGALRMVPEETFTVIALQEDDTDLSQHRVRMKLFGRDANHFDEDDYYESFFTVDLPNGFVYWNEKDKDYRAPLIRAMRTP